MKLSLIAYRARSGPAVALFATLLLSACSTVAPTQVLPAVGSPAAVPDTGITAAVDPAPQVSPTPGIQDTAAPTQGTGITPPPIATTPEDIEPVAVTYTTPSQAEGPYYPLEKPTERDNDLTVVPGASGAPAGQILLLGGRLLDRGGYPVAGAVIEIWQTDAEGIYLHPGDPDTDTRDPNFQFYGEARTGSDGSYNFRTIIPGQYEPRPRHIHVKVKLDGRELLTTQFYFPEDALASGDGILAAAGDSGDALLVALERSADGESWLGSRDIVLSE